MLRGAEEGVDSPQPDDGNSTNVLEGDVEDTDLSTETERERRSGVPGASPGGRERASSCGCWGIALALVVLLAWLAGLWENPEEPTAEERVAEAVADTVAWVEGEWTSALGDRTLELDAGSYRAELTYRGDEGKLMGHSSGRWRVDQNRVHIELRGDAGSYVADLEPIDGMGCDLLVPTPVAEALLVSCYWRAPRGDAEWDEP